MMNDLLPQPAVLREVHVLSDQDRLFHFATDRPLFVAPGQFVEISIPGIGGFPVSPCDLVDGKDIYSCIRRAGRVTSALFNLEAGAPVGLRGPFGNGFDLSACVDREVLVVAGGLGIAPLRAMLAALLANGRHRTITLLFGARTRAGLLFSEELAALARSEAIRLQISLEEGSADVFNQPDSDISCKIGLVTALLDDVAVDGPNTVAVVSGPPVLYQHTLERLADKGIPPGRIFATLERRMRCGIGECCHCVTGGVYLCLEGPVFTLAKMRAMEGSF